MKIFLLVLALALCVSGIRWTHTNKNGDVVTRTVNIVRGPPSNPNTFEVLATRNDKTTHTKDALDFRFSTVGIPRFVLRYFMKDSDSKESLLHRWAVWKVFEYDETDGVPGFDPATENITSSYSLFLRRFTQMNYNKYTDSDGAVIHSVCTDLNPIDQSTPFPDVTFCAHAAEKEGTANRTHINPNSLKWSISISNYPYQSASGRLGLKVSFDSRNIVKDLSATDASDENDESQAALDMSSDDDNSHRFRGIAAWVTTVDVTGTGCAATSTVVRSVVLDQQISTDDENPPTDPDIDATIKIRVSYFSFPTNCVQPASIVWDPELGVSTDDSGAFSLKASFLFVIAMIFVALKL